MIHEQCHWSVHIVIVSLENRNMQWIIVMIVGESKCTMIDTRSLSVVTMPPINQFASCINSLSCCLGACHSHRISSFFVISVPRKYSMKGPIKSHLLWNNDAQHIIMHNLDTDWHNTSFLRPQEMASAATIYVILNRYQNHTTQRRNCLRHFQKSSFFLFCRFAQQRYKL